MGCSNSVTQNSANHSDAEGSTELLSDLTKRVRDFNPLVMQNKGTSSSSDIPCPYFLKDGYNKLQKSKEKIEKDLKTDQEPTPEPKPKFTSLTTIRKPQPTKKNELANQNQRFSHGSLRKFGGPNFIIKRRQKTSIETHDRFKSHDKLLKNKFFKVNRTNACFARSEKQLSIRSKLKDRHSPHSRTVVVQSLVSDTKPTAPFKQLDLRRAVIKLGLLKDDLKPKLKEKSQCYKKIIKVGREKLEKLKNKNTGLQGVDRPRGSFCCSTKDQQSVVVF